MKQRFESIKLNSQSRSHPISQSDGREGRLTIAFASKSQCKYATAFFFDIGKHAAFPVPRGILPTTSIPPIPHAGPQPVFQHDDFFHLHGDSADGGQLGERRCHRRHEQLLFGRVSDRNLTTRVALRRSKSGCKLKEEPKILFRFRYASFLFLLKAIIFSFCHLLFRSD